VPVSATALKTFDHRPTRLNQDDGPPSPPEPPGGHPTDEGEAYAKAVDSVVWIHAIDRNWEATRGTGVVVDAPNGLILTAYHVVRNDRLALAVFPARDAQGTVIGNPDHYLNDWSTHARQCVIVASDPKKELALLRLKTPPPGLKALPLAPRSAGPGQALFLIGSSSPKALWRYAGGNVRQLYDDSFRFASGQEVQARLIETSIPVNPGDSGAPMVNKNGELVGINSGFLPGQNQVQLGIDRSEIQALLDKAQQK
jgi:S1-C subfamily serine protease